MKKVIFYFSFFILILSFSCVTISLVFKTALDSKISAIFDLEGDKEGTEKEKSSEKEEKEMNYYIKLNYYQASSKMQCFKLNRNQYISFSSSDYSQVVYSPPENFI